jgi:flagellar hook-length control protein FliK
MEVQLDPPEMGRLLVKLVRSEGGLRASFVVSSESARLAVQNEMPALQRALEQAGVTLTGFSVAQHGQGHAGDRSAEEPALRSRYNNRATSPGRSSTAEAYARPIRQGAIDLKV